MPFPRSSGILLHPTSLPSRFGIGDIGSNAYQFVDFLKNTGQQIWQILPIGPTGFGNSPYLSYSASAGNPLLICPDRLCSEGLLTEDDLADLPQFPLEQVDFDVVRPYKMGLFQTAFKHFQKDPPPGLEQEFQAFCTSKAAWLDDYALFMAIKTDLKDASWHTWESEIARRQPEAVKKWKERLKDEVLFQQFLQFQFFRQWSDLKQYANQQGIQLFGDVAIYVAHDSADVWSNPDIFRLDEKTREPALMAGVPPDYFSETGQLWGNPVYNWEKLQQQDFAWWVQRMESMLDLVDLIRIDHFRGLEAYWAVPQGETTAIKGQWIEAPGVAFFKTLEEKLGRLPIIAEDLGTITPEVEALRDQFELPGMKILHFAFDSGRDNAYLPYNYSSPNWVVYTGTHDNDTTLGWFLNRDLEAKARVTRYLGSTSDYGIHWDMIILALASVANQAIFPLQDILGLGSEAMMNKPGTAAGNWAWRFEPGALTDEIGDRLRFWTETYGRLPNS